MLLLNESFRCTSDIIHTNQISKSYRFVFLFGSIDRYLIELDSLSTPNSCDDTAQTLVGDETSHASRESALVSILRPFDRGYVTNWEPEFEVGAMMPGRVFREKIG